MLRQWNVEWKPGWDFTGGEMGIFEEMRFGV